MNYIFSSLFRLVIAIYQKMISPFFLPTCRYSPTCSEYAIQAIKKHGAWKGTKLMIKRIFSCHPWGGEGNSPVV